MILLTCQGTSIELSTRCVAQFQNTILDMCLRLEEPNPIVQLRGHRNQLIICRQNPYEGRIVGTDLCNVGI
jgi:hypothetical protein